MWLTFFFLGQASSKKFRTLELKPKTLKPTNHKPYIDLQR